MMKWNFQRLFYKLIIIILEFFSKYYLSLNFKDKVPCKNDFKLIESYKEEINCAIIIQGPLVGVNSFTYETLKLYKHLYPKSLIVLSTWQNENESQLNRINKLGITVLKNEPPFLKGTSNINLQLESVKSALRYINKKSNIEYVLKTRTDQRITRQMNFLGFFKSLIREFPLNKMELINERLVICSLNTFLNRIYGVSDMIMFGGIREMNLYWNIPNQNEIIKAEEFDFRYFVKNNIAEGYLVSSFMEKLNYSPKWTITDGLSFIKKYFIVVDKEQLDLFWFKYERWIENNSINARNTNNEIELRFSDWINIKQF
tara:strand:- start:13 stop:957 length:945 start_codon:yes stop_codon:yes gene_type:complete